MTYYIKKFYVFKSRMNKLVFSWPFTRLRREVVNISQFPTVPNSGHFGGTTVPRDYDTGNKKLTLVANVCLFGFYNFY